MSDPKFRQLVKYKNEADDFWSRWKKTLEDELNQFLKLSPLELLESTKQFADVTVFPELALNSSSINQMQTLISRYGREQLAKDLINYGTNTKLLTMLVAPALAAADGMGVDRSQSEKCIYAVGINHAVAADIADSVLDKDLKSNPALTTEEWVSSYILGAAALYRIGQDYLKTMDERIKVRTDKGIEIVSRAEKLDLLAKTSPDVSESTVEEIYDGKIGEIEGTIFSCINILGGEKHPEFEPGSLHLANEGQIGDDYEDMMENSVPPIVPNPSFFLTYARNFWRDKQATSDTDIATELDDVIRRAAIESKTKGQIYHQKVVGEYEKLDQSFPTKAVFDSILDYMNKYLVSNYEIFMEGKTFPTIRPQLAKLMQVPYKV